jgi:pimeloyl-ACP methyl ester carboxylesterase
MPRLEVNAADLYYEVRGAGPPVLLIMGATGDSGVFEAFADLLAKDFTIVTYDRRGNGRSAAPTSWATTSPEEQADDAAALLSALGLAPAGVFGTSSGGVFALAMMLRHPRTVRAAVLHEPAFFALFDDPDTARTVVTDIVTAGMHAGGSPEAFERFIRFVAGDSNWERLNPSIQARMLTSADTYFGKEIGRFDSYLPDEHELANIAAPVHIVVGNDSLPQFGQAAHRLAERLKTEVTHVPGTHFGYLDHPHELARTVSALLQGPLG